MRKRVLITNDDGILAPALQVLREVVERTCDTVVVAPDREQSAASHALTLNRPLRLNEIKPRTFAVDGTPTDCVMLAVMGFLDYLPDLVISGINNGPNLCEDVIYSGTVAGAAEAALLKIPAIATSFADPSAIDMAWGAEKTMTIADAVFANGLPEGVFLNVNIPARSENARVEVTSLGRRTYRDVIVKKTDPRGKPYYWIGGQAEQWVGPDTCDVAAVERGNISVTPMHLDMTSTADLDSVGRWTFGG